MAGLEKLNERFRREGLTRAVIEQFRSLIYSYYREHKRAFPWREDTSDYSVFISEVMLQQTQAGKRTIEKYDEFMKRFPDFNSLASASFSEILSVWKGLGYNRRALALKKAAEIIMQNHDGKLPQTLLELDALPGIGMATACSISAFAFNNDVVFIETNIRSVFIYHFFNGVEKVNDKDLMVLVEKTLDRGNAREWYSALMDYGSMLKRNVGNVSRNSKHYSKQSRFEGSDRQLRGIILDLLFSSSLTTQDLARLSTQDNEKINRIVTTMTREGLLTRSGEKISLA